MRLIAPPATAASLPDLTAQFNAEIIQGHREAFQALREIMAEAATLSMPSPEADPADNTPQARAAANAVTRRLSLRLRAATAILRVKPIKDADHASAAPRSAPPSPAQWEKVAAVLSAAKRTEAGSQIVREAIAPCEAG